MHDPAQLDACASMPAQPIESASASTANQENDSIFAYGLTAAVLGLIMLIALAFSLLIYTGLASFSGYMSDYADDAYFYDDSDDPFFEDDEGHLEDHFFEDSPFGTHGVIQDSSLKG